MGTTCTVEVPEEGDRSKWRIWTQIFPEDANRSQRFELPSEGVEEGVESLKLVFEKSSDFFGRITVYDIQLQGTLL